MNTKPECLINASQLPHAIHNSNLGLNYRDKIENIYFLTEKTPLPQNQCCYQSFWVF